MSRGLAATITVRMTTIRRETPVLDIAMRRRDEEEVTKITAMEEKVLVTIEAVHPVEAEETLVQVIKDKATSIIPVMEQVNLTIGEVIATKHPMVLVTTPEVDNLAALQHLERRIILTLGVTGKVTNRGNLL